MIDLHYVLFGILPGTARMLLNIPLDTRIEGFLHPLHIISGQGKEVDLTGVIKLLIMEGKVCEHCIAFDMFYSEARKEVGSTARQQQASSHFAMTFDGADGDTLDRECHIREPMQRNIL